MNNFNNSVLANPCTLPVSILLVFLEYLILLTKIFITFMTRPLLSGTSKKFYSRLIRVLLSTEIFSKRRKIYTSIEGKPELILPAEFHPSLISKRFFFTCVL